MTVIEVGAVRDSVARTLIKQGHKDAGYRAAMMPAPLLKQMAEWKPPRKHDPMTMEREVARLLGALRAKKAKEEAWRSVVR